jgi:hypothetical protein
LGYPSFSVILGVYYLDVSELKNHNGQKIIVGVKIYTHRGSSVG